MVIRHLIPSVYDRQIMLFASQGRCHHGNSFSVGDGEDKNFNTKQSKVKWQEFYFLYKTHDVYLIEII